MLFDALAGMTVEFKHIRQVFIYAFAAAVVYCIAAFFYIRNMSFEQTYVLYIGNFLFAAVIGIFIAWFYKQHEAEIGTIRLVVVGGKAAFAGIAFACVLLLILLLMMVPGVFKPEAVSGIELQHSPGQFEGKNKGFGAILFLNAVIGNAGASFFISLLIPFAVMKNLYGRKEKPAIPSAKQENPKKNYNL